MSRCSIVVIVLWNTKEIRDSGSVGRAQPCQGWGRGFEPRLSLLKGIALRNSFFRVIIILIVKMCFEKRQVSFLSQIIEEQNPLGTQHI